MSDHEKLIKAIFERIVNHQETEDDREKLRNLLGVQDGSNKIQIGKHIVNIAEGRDIHIGDKIYHNTDAEAIRKVLQEVISEGIVKAETQQDILKDIVTGRDLTTGNIQQENIQNQINLIFNISDFGAISKAFSAIQLPDGWWDWRDKPKNIEEILSQLIEIPHGNSDNSPLLNFIYLLTQDNSIPQIKREKLGQLLTNYSFVRSLQHPSQYGQPEHMANYRNLPIGEHPNNSNDHGWVHHNSGIHNKAAYNLLTSQDNQGNYLFDVTSAARIFYLALTRLSHNSDFSDSRRAIVESAKILFRRDNTELKNQKLYAIANAFDRVGIE